MEKTTTVLNNLKEPERDIQHMNGLSDIKDKYKEVNPKANYPYFLLLHFIWHQKKCNLKEVEQEGTVHKTKFDILCW